VPRAVDVRGGIEDDRVGGDALFAHDQDHGTNDPNGIAQTSGGHERVKSYIAVATDEDW
jgi:hypothetical protein